MSITAPTEPTRAVDVVRKARRAPRRHHAYVVAVLAALLFGAFVARVLLGDYIITVPDFFRILGGAEIPGATFLLMSEKLPRAILGVLVGVAFGIAGAVFQSTLRNPLASPDIVGVSLGASASAVFAIVVLDLEGLALSVAAILGALAIAVAVRLVAGSDGSYRLVLVGVTAAAAMTAVVHYLFTRANEFDALLVLRWLTGALNGVTWPTIWILLGFLVVLIPALAWISRSAQALQLGPDVATGLGVSRRRTDLLLLLAVLLTALGVAAAGPVAFVAFVAGPISRALNGGRTTLVGAALVGAIVMVAGDYIADYAVPGVSFPVGVVTGAFGAPFLLWLLTRARR
ncbi:FecCD family ABC transporter permease [Nocardioides albus]|uniref:Iron complex transport system permease protein n=1 Tax=Nocardioides albus TaxID=1841 RepID=A0A7W5A6R6_9ACTN|nr:iron chelate uptake ABC transporter family permease subunit [Nocardioides albus]MBB3090636.1 iron complex transport system permease protein [Nocardioides albus]GGU25349.1 ABC transporter permease [Nocardioides albus]